MKLHTLVVVLVALGVAKAQDKFPVRLNTPDQSLVSEFQRIDNNGMVRALYNISSPAYNGTSEDAARSFLSENASLLNMETSAQNLRVQQILNNPGSAHVRFAQHHEGIPVFRADVAVSLNTLNEVGMVINNYKSGISLRSNVPSIDQPNAIGLAKSSLNVTGNPIGKEDAASLVVYEAPDHSWHLAYRVTMTRDNPPADWEVFVDAHTGTVLHSEDQFALYVQGRGYVYKSDPLSSARKMYNTPGFVDGDDADTDSLNYYRTFAELDSISYEHGVYKLKGPFCRVADIESPADPEYTANTSEGFTFTRNHQAFEAVNVYFHISKSYQYINSLGFSIPSLSQIRLDPHGYQGQDNSHYSPSGNWIAWGDGGVDDAEDADVILHEYGHAIQYNIIPNWGGGECGALGEGFGDYWAASYSRSLDQWSTIDYHYNWLFDWDGHNPFWSGRITNDTRVYPFGGLPIHSAGQIWSAALIGIWDALGKEVTDRLVLKSMYYLGSGTTATDNAQALLQADRDLYNGAHIEILQYWLGTVKHFINAPVAGVDENTPTASSLLQNFPNPFNPSTTISFSLEREMHLSLRIYNVLGEEVTTLAEGMHHSGNFNVTWNGTNGSGELVGSGMYFSRLETKAPNGTQAIVQTRKMLLIR